MNKMIFYVAIAALALSTVSCVESSNKYKTMMSERDSLLLQSQALESNYNETLSIINEIEDSFAAIRQSEGVMAAQVKSIEGQSVSKKQQFGTELEQIKNLWKDNKEKIAKLQRRLAQSGKENATLKSTIERFEAELLEKGTMIAGLQEELSKKKVEIEGLTATIEDLNTNVTQLNETTTQQKATIEQQDADLNTVGYLIATNKALKAGNIVTSNGIFKAKSVMKKEFDKSLFTTTDLRTLTTIPTESKKVKILTSHPEDSYKLNVADDKMITIEITNAEKFWSISKYLVAEK